MEGKRGAYYIGICTIVLGIALVTALPVSAEDTYWDYEGETAGAWATADNWDNGVPEEGDVAYIGNGYEAEISTGSAVTTQLAVYGDSTLSLTSGSASLYVSLGEGVGYNSDGTFNHVDGEHEVAGSLRIGYYNSEATGIYTISAGTLTVADTLAVDSGTFTMNGGEVTADAVTVGSARWIGDEEPAVTHTGDLIITDGEMTIAGTLGLGTSSSYAVGNLTMSGGVLNVVDIKDAKKAGEAEVVGSVPENTITMSGGVINVSNDFTINSHYDESGCSGVTSVAATGGTINMTGTGDLAGAGGCMDGFNNPLPTVTAAASGQTTTITDSVGVMSLVTGDGTLTGTPNHTLTLRGDGDAWVLGDTEVSGIPAICYSPLSGGDTNIAAIDYSDVEKLQMLSLADGDHDTVFTLQDDVTSELTDLLIAKYLAENPNEVGAVLDLNGNALSVRNIAVGYFDENGEISENNVFASIDASIPGSSITASDTLAVFKGGTLTVGAGVEVTANTVYLLGDLVNSGIITGVESVTVSSGGVFINDGIIQAGLGGTYAVLVEADATLTGSATYSDATFQIYGNISPGQSPGVDVFDGAETVVTLEGGGLYTWELWKAGVPDPGPNPNQYDEGTGYWMWDYLQFTDDATMVIDASTELDPYTIDVYGWTGTEQGDPFDFDVTDMYQWLIVDGEDSDTITGFSADRFEILSHITGASSENFYLTYDSDNGDIYLNYNGVPEPATMAAVIFGGLMVAWRKLRRKRKLVRAKK